MMNYKVSTETSMMFDAINETRSIYKTIYGALLLKYAEDDVLSMMEKGFNPALEALQKEIFELLRVTIDEKLGDKVNPGLI